MTAEALFTSCAAKTCCSRYTVYLTGQDVFRLSRILNVPPWGFCGPVATEPDDPEGFVLHAGGPRQRLALLRHPGEGDLRPCTFLLRLPAGPARCGVSPIRPIGCQAFPCAMSPQGVTVPENLCTCRRWSEDDVDLEAHGALLRREASEQAVDRRVVATWNGFAESLPAERPADFQDFCRYLLDAQGEMEEAAGVAG